MRRNPGTPTPQAAACVPPPNSSPEERARPRLRRSGAGHGEHRRDSTAPRNTAARMSRLSLAADSRVSLCDDAASCPLLPDRGCSGSTRAGAVRDPPLAKPRTGPLDSPSREESNSDHEWNNLYARLDEEEEDLKRLMATLTCSTAIALVGGGAASADPGPPGTTFPEQPGAHNARSCTATVENPVPLPPPLSYCDCNRHPALHRRLSTRLMFRSGGSRDDRLPVVLLE